MVCSENSAGSSDAASESLRDICEFHMKEPASDSSAQTIASCRNSDEAGAIVMELSVPGKGLIKYVDLRTVSCSEKDTEFL
jgi:hypothetical protein